MLHDATGPGNDRKPKVTWEGSGNMTLGRAGAKIDTVVLHHTTASFASVKNHFLNPKSKVSAHFVVTREGFIHEFVAENNTAWHAGDRATNRRSIGIEIEATKPGHGLARMQEKALVELCKYLLDAYDVPASRVIGHCTVKATACPGWIWPTTGDLKKWVATHLNEDTQCSSTSLAHS